MSKKDIYMPEHLTRDEEGNITKREDVTLVTEDYSIKTQGTTLDKKLAEVDLTNKAEQERLDNLSEVVVESGNSMSESISDLEKMKWGKDELEIGGRNLIEDTSDEWIEIKNNSQWGRIISTDYKLIGGQTYVLSGILNPVSEIEVSLGFIAHFDGVNEVLSKHDWVQSGVKRVHTIVTVPEKYDNWNFKYQIRNKDSIGSDEPDNTVRYSEIKLEKGNISTDWTPAPEDIGGVQTQPAPVANMNHIEYLENQIKELREMIALRGLSR